MPRIPGSAFLLPKRGEKPDGGTLPPKAAVRLMGHNVTRQLRGYFCWAECIRHGGVLRKERSQHVFKKANCVAYPSCVAVDVGVGGVLCGERTRGGHQVRLPGVLRRRGGVGPAWTPHVAETRRGEQGNRVPLDLVNRSVARWMLPTPRRSRMKASERQKCPPGMTHPLPGKEPLAGDWPRHFKSLISRVLAPSVPKWD